MKKTKLSHCLLLLAVLLSLWQEQSLAQDKLEQAEAALKKQNYMRAETLCNEFINESSDEIAKAKGHALLGQVYMELVKSNTRYYTNVENNLKTAITKDPNNSSYRRQLGDLYERLGKSTEAVAQYEKVVALGNDDEALLRKLIEYFESKQNPDKLLRYYRRLVEHKPSDSIAHYRIGQILRDQGLASNAKEAQEKAILANGENWDAHVELGELYEAEGKYEPASQTFGKARNFNSKAQEGWMRTMSSQKSLDFIQGVIQASNQALARKSIPELTRLCTRLDSLQTVKPFNQDLKQKFQEVQKSLCDLWFQKAQAYYTNGHNLALASSAFDSSFAYANTEADKGRARDGASRAQAEFGVQRRVEAVQTEAEKALKERKLKEAQQGFIAVSVFDPSRRSTLNPKQKQAEIESWYVLGMVAMDSSNWEDAKFSFSRVMALDSTFMDNKTKTWLHKAEIELARRQRFAFFSKMADSTYKNERWAVANFALTELQQLLPNDPTIAQRLKRTKDELGITKTIKRVLTFWSVLAFAIIASGVLFLSKSTFARNGRARETPAFDWTRP